MEATDAEPEKAGILERHAQTLIMAVILAVVVFIGAQYSGQDKRIALTEQQMWVASQNIVNANTRMQRLEDRGDANMKDIREMVQRIEDKIDKKADKE